MIAQADRLTLTPPPDGHIVEALKALAGLIGSEPFEIVVKRRGQCLWLQVADRTEDLQTELPTPPPEVAAELSPLEKTIVGACGRKPLTAKRIAGAVSRQCNSYFRGVLRGLCRRGVLEMTPDGYRLSRHPEDASTE